jgi:hypothetical protein
MKTCKTGCGKMKAGGSVKKVKEMADGGSTGLVGMPRYSNNPRSEQGRILKKGGSIKKYPDGGATIPGLIKKDRREIMRTPSGKLGVGASVAGIVGVASKAIADKIKANRAAKKASEEKKKKDAATPKAKFGATVNVQRGYPGKIRSADDQGYTAIGKREPARTKFEKGGFPDLNKDGKITKADILKGRGVIKKKGGSVKKK